MMDQSAIKESGMLERYLLGELSHTEVLHVERALAGDPDLMAYFRIMENDLEKMAFENAVAPPASSKLKLMDSIREDSVSVIPINETGETKAYLAIAASLALLFGVTSFWLYTKINSMEDDLRLVQDENSELNNNVQLLETQLAETAQWYEAVNDPAAIKLILQGNANSPNALAVSYVNHETKSVVLNAKGLPELDREHDYQLWADVKGEMINMGVIPRNSEMIAMTYIENAESLNITIEPAGGNDHPTVANLISNVYLN